LRAPIPESAVRAPRDLAPFLDHTLLSPGASERDAARVCEEARAHGFAAVCLRAPFVPLAARLLSGSGVRVAAVVDFPLGEGATAARLREAEEAIRLGATELDLVAPLPLIRAGRWAAVFDDLRSLVRASAAPLKVILETGILAMDEKVAAAAVARAAGAAFVKTSTGFAGIGATVEDVSLLRSVVGERIGVKASGGVRTADDALAMIRAGASRIGASASVAIVGGAFRK
jgi:deoxyribose-phosphate aldolase